MTHRTQSRSRRLLTPARIALVAAAGLTLALGTSFAGSSPAGATGPVAVHALGGAPSLGAPATALNAPIVAIAATHNGGGYWLLGQDGGIFSYGNAVFHGSTGAMQLNQPVVGMAATPSGHGYWLVAADGGIFSFGDAHFYGSTGAIHLNSPVVGMASTPTGHGYWLVAADGGIFSFGDAAFHGSTGGLALGTTVAGMTTTPSGKGYWIATADGRIFAFGDAHPIAGFTPAGPIVGLQAAPGGGLWLVSNTGAVYATGGAHYAGGASDPMMQAVGIAAAAPGHGYWVATIPSGPPLPANSGTGRRIVYSNAQQRIWLVEANGIVSHTYLVSGRHGLPAVGTYHVFAKLPMDPDGSLMLPWTLKFDPLANGVVNIHGIPLRLDGTPIEPDSLLGTPQSHGCLRLSQVNAKVVYDWTPIGTPVVVMDIG